MGVQYICLGEINQSINQSINKSINQSINQSIKSNRFGGVMVNEPSSGKTKDYKSNLVLLRQVHSTKE
jgi:hypothetical protein